MTRYDVIRMARESGMLIPSFRIGGGLALGTCTVPDFERFAALVAEAAPSTPEGWKLVPTAESRHPGIYKMLSVLHAVDNTPGASEWESYAAFLAAAPEAKPCP